MRGHKGIGKTHAMGRLSLLGQFKFSSAAMAMQKESCDCTHKSLVGYMQNVDTTLYFAPVILTLTLVSFSFGGINENRYVPKSSVVDIHALLFSQSIAVS